MSQGFPKMVQDLRGRLSDAAGYVRDIWFQYNVHPPIIRDMTEVERMDNQFVDNNFVENWF